MEPPKTAHTTYGDFNGTVQCEDHARVNAMARKAGVPQTEKVFGVHAYRESGDVIVTIYAATANDIDEVREKIIAGHATVREYLTSYSPAEFLRLFTRFDMVIWDKAVEDVVFSNSIAVDRPSGDADAE